MDCGIDEYYDYKNQLMSDILTSETIVRLIDESISLDNASSLAYTKVFPFEYLPETVEHGDTYVCFEVDITRAPSKTYLIPTIYVWVIAHHSLMRLPNGEGVRVDKLCSEICKKINGSRFYGLGELEFNSSKRFSPLSGYNGKMLTFITEDFNRLHDASKSIPPRRK